MPKLNKDPKDPTGQARNRDRANRALARRLERSRIEVSNLFASINRRRVSTTKVRNSLEVNEVSFVYEIDDQSLQMLSLEIARILDFNLETSNDFVPHNWFYKEFVEVAFRSGALDDLRDTQQVVSELQQAEIIETPLGQVVIDATIVTRGVEYQRSLAIEYANNYKSVKSLSSTTAAQVYGEIQRGIEAGQNSKTVRRAITKRFDVSKSSAERIARTGINEAYNNAKLKLTEQMEEQFNVKLGNMHISALLATTRHDHAARHGKAYSVTDQLQWWNSGANRINCYCTTQKVVIDPKGNVLNVELQDEVKKQGDEFFGK